MESSANSKYLGTSIRLAGESDLQLIEAFNVFDEDNVSGEGSVFCALTTRQLVPQANFRTPTATAGPQIIQLAAKIQSRSLKPTQSTKGPARPGPSCFCAGPKSPPRHDRHRRDAAVRSSFTITWRFTIMIRSIANFAAAWEYEHEATMKIFRALTDASLAQRVTPEGRSLGVLAWHIVQTLGEMPQQAALPVEAPGEDAPLPTSASRISEEFDRAAQSVTKVVAATWSDASLGEDIPMYGETWKKGDVLSSLILHQAHHRGQMTVLMRQAGLMVPGIYGPAKEEWAAMGMAAPQ